MFSKEIKTENVGIKDAKLFLNSIFERNLKFKEYSSFYKFTTENLRESIGEYTEKDRILTILSSGDHVFNYLLKGASNIEAFDINKVTKYYFKLKCAEIISNSCEKYSELSKRITFHITLKDLDSYRYYLDKETYEFWKYCLLNADDCMYLLSRASGVVRQKRKEYNIYFEKENYDKLQSILENGFTIRFHLCDISKLPLDMNGEYSEVHLSNVFDYVENACDVIKGITSDIQKHLTPDGKIILYAYGNPSYVDDLGFEKKVLSNKQKVYTLKK